MRLLLAGVFVAAAMALPGGSSSSPTLLASVPVLASLASSRRTVVMNYGTFEGHPAVWDDRVGHVLFDRDDGWKKIPVAELDQFAAVMSKAAFDAAFPGLPPVPK
jgi:hypothetical protein